MSEDRKVNQILEAITERKEKEDLEQSGKIAWDKSWKEKEKKSQEMKRMARIGIILNTATHS